MQQLKVVLRKIVICAWDINVLRSYSLHEQEWKTRLGTLKVSGLYYEKGKFPLKISDRAWWLEVQILKSQDMKVDCIKNSTPDLSAKACQTKNILTEGNHPHESTVLAKTPDEGISNSNILIKVQPERPFYLLSTCESSAD